MNTLLAQIPVDIGKELLLKKSTPIGTAPQFASPGALISVILPNVYIAAGIALFFLILFGGISVITGAGQNDPKKAAQGKKAITSALIGFLIIFASYWIIQIIEVITGFKILSPDFSGFSYF